MKRVVINVLVLLVGLILVAPIAIILLPLMGLNWMVNSLSGFLSRRAMTWTDILRYEPEIGWQPRANLNAPYYDRIGDRCTIETDSEGWPGRHSMEDSDIVAFGDSFAFGYGATQKEAYFSLSRASRIKPIGAPGYNMVQALMLMKRYAPRLRGKLVVFFICMENDLAENLKPYNPKFYTNPFLRTINGKEEWQIASEHVSERKWMHAGSGVSNKVLFSHICTPSPYSERVFSAARYLIQEAKTVCAREGAELVIFSIPYKFQLYKGGLRMLRNLLKDPTGFDAARPEKVLAKICEQVDVPFLEGSRYLTAADYKERDGHWNAQGNRKVAAILEGFRGRHETARGPVSEGRSGTRSLTGLRRVREAA